METKGLESPPSRNTQHSLKNRGALGSPVFITARCIWVN